MPTCTSYRLYRRIFGESSCQHVARHHPGWPPRAHTPTRMSRPPETLQHRPPRPRERPDNPPCPTTALTRFRLLRRVKTPNPHRNADTRRRRVRTAHHTDQRPAPPPPPRTT